MKHTILVLLMVAFFSGGCSKFSRVMKNPDWRTRYAAALKYYEAQDYYRAGILLEDLVPIMRGQKEAETANYYYANCYFEQGQYILSAHYFKNFHDTYRRSPLAVKALYHHAMSMYLDSPVSNLDQSNTNQAINALQDFINRYPESEYIAEATALITEMQRKLEKKAYDIAQLYYNLSMYKAAIIAFDNFQKDYPDSHQQEDAAFMKIKASYDLAEKSYYIFQKARYQEVITHYEVMLEKFPNSTLLKDAQIYFDNTHKGLRKLEKLMVEIEKEQAEQQAKKDKTE